MSMEKLPRHLSDICSMKQHLLWSLLCSAQGSLIIDLKWP